MLGKGEVYVYEAHEVKKKNSSLLNRRKITFRFLFFDLFTWEKYKKRSLIYYSLLRPDSPETPWKTLNSSIKRPFFGVRNGPARRFSNVCVFITAVTITKLFA